MATRGEKFKAAEISNLKFQIEKQNQRRKAGAKPHTKAAKAKANANVEVMAGAIAAGARAFASPLETRGGAPGRKSKA